MSAGPKGKRVVGEALARAMYDAPLYVLRTLNKDGYSHSSAMEIARRMVRELDHAGWSVKSSNRGDRMKLEDSIAFGLSMADCSRLGSQSPEWSKTARDQATLCICGTLRLHKVVLVRRNAR